MSLPDIAAKLAQALRNMPCMCVETGAWPRFKPEVKAHPERVCQRCASLALYDAHRAIVQTPETKL